MNTLQNHKVSSQVKYDGNLTIATGRSRKETNWKNSETLWSDLLKRLSRTTRTGETLSEYKKFSKSQQSAIKDVGGFLGGTLKGGRRKVDSVVWRQLITLDADFVKGDLWASVEVMADYACAIYSTHKHEPANPRLRLVIPLSRPVTPDEYQAVSRKIASYIGIDNFDDTSFQPHRLMYWPSTSHDGEFLFEYQDEAWLDPDDILSSYEDWKDPSYWPESSRVQQARRKMADKQGDPHEKTNIVGDFCRTYSIPEAIETFLADVYEPATEGRYTYLEGTTAGGLILYEDEKFAYSHHGTDPVSGQLVNAFDLVRIHKFGDQDEMAKEGTPSGRMPSYKAMKEFASKQKSVLQAIDKRRLEEAGQDFEEEGFEEDWGWMKELKRNGKNVAISNSYNVKLILQNDPNLAGKFAKDVFSFREVLVGSVPWRKVDGVRALEDTDDAGLRNYLSDMYDITGRQVIDDSLSEILAKNEFHPVRDYLNGLKWDGVPRIDRLLIDWMGAEDTKLVQAQTRKTLVAAVKRIFEPGCKFDYVLTLLGSQGLGKSSFIELLGGEWFSDTLDDVRGKDAYEQLQGKWIVELGELAALKKADIERIKSFITIQTDNFRQAYAKRSGGYPRQCIFIATTNDEQPFKDQTGNRRFWPVKVGIREIDLESRKDFPRDQVWAEAMALYQKGEKLFLSKELESQAKQEQQKYTEESVYAEQIRDILETPQGEEFGGKGELLDRVCAAQIWDLLLLPKQGFTAVRAKEFNAVLRNTPGWIPFPTNNGKAKIKGYGCPAVFIREQV